MPIFAIPIMAQNNTSTCKMTSNNTTPAQQTFDQAEIIAVIEGIKKSIKTLEGWLGKHISDTVVVTKDRMHNVINVDGIATVGIYPALPTVFRNKDVANQIAKNFKAYKGDREQLLFEVVPAKHFALWCIENFNVRIAQISQLLA